MGRGKGFSFITIMYSDISNDGILTRDIKKFPVNLFNDKMEARGNSF